MHLYIHIPFCKQACHYCDFHFSVNLKNKSEMVTAIANEIKLQKDFLSDKKLKTIYFGGGTPSLLNELDLEVIFKSIRNFYDLSGIEEITMEANPDDIKLDLIKIWKKYGVNRISLGVQTFDDEQLNNMNRNHSGSEALTSIEILKNEGLHSISIDIIYAKITDNELKAHQTLENDLKKVIDFQLPHVSAYCLTIEPQTVYGKWLKTNKIKPIDEDYSFKQYEILTDRLGGYEQYEISNFSLNGSYAKHNSSYWLNKAYLGVGPSAHSFNKDTRQANVSNNIKYLKAIAENKVPATVEYLSISEKANDYLLCGLRTIWGVNLAILGDIVPEISNNFHDSIKKKQDLGLLNLENNILKITKKGRFLSDGIAADLFFD